MGFGCNAHLALQHELRAATCRSLLSMPDIGISGICWEPWVQKKKSFCIGDSSSTHPLCKRKLLSASGPIKELLGLGAVNSVKPASFLKHQHRTRPSICLPCETSHDSTRLGFRALQRKIYITKDDLPCHILALF